MSAFNAADFLAIAAAIFVAELTDKDAFLLLALATSRRALFVFVCGSLAFTLTTAIITTFGYLLLEIVPVFWIKLAGAVVMISYAIWQFFRSGGEEENENRKNLSGSVKKSALAGFLSTVGMLALLDLAGDATEILTIVFLAHFQNVILVFAGTVSALIAATALETFLGIQLRRILSPARLRALSILILVSIGSIIIITTLL